MYLTFCGPLPVFHESYTKYILSKNKLGEMYRTVFKANLKSLLQPYLFRARTTTSVYWLLLLFGSFKQQCTMGKSGKKVPFIYCIFLQNVTNVCLYSYSRNQCVLTSSPGITRLL